MQSWIFVKNLKKFVNLKYPWAIIISIEVNFFGKLFQMNKIVLFLTWDLGYSFALNFEMNDLGLLKFIFQIYFTNTL